MKPTEQQAALAAQVTPTEVKELEAFLAANRERNEGKVW